MLTSSLRVQAEVASESVHTMAGTMSTRSTEEQGLGYWLFLPREQLGETVP